MTQNVVGVLEGSDAVLRNEYVAIGAHYDHVGTGQPVAGDAIYNGADDDGSGTVGVLAVAEAFARGVRPKRSVLFIWHCGEEKGLWGSEYFTRFPTVPLKQIVAQLNMDMIGRSKQEGDTKEANRALSGANEIYVIGSKMMSTELGELSERVNRAYLNLNFNYKYDDPADTNRFFFRSDHYHYAQHGIPIIFYFDGVHEDYHRPSDSADKIDYQKMEKVTRTIFLTAHELANAPTRPRVDKQLPQQLTGR
jgi:Zn-dependent M28 family amino/carboxypeptidase